ncbi:MAG TPA: class I SAM-dependent methyltransferase [Stellaceae bacterium]|nr:class I SAM-dependent methyltransferase [Stellaceae bacterium]
MPRHRSNTAVPGERVVDQRWDPGRYQENAGFVAVLGAPLFEMLAPKAGERILDLGCGDGALTEKIAAVATVVAVDASADQIKAARARGLDAHVVDGTKLAFDAEFDAVFSNAALHWMRDPDAVIAGVWRALRPGGRFVAECGGAGNVELILRALVAALERRGLDGRAAIPWYFPAPEEYRGRLERQGFVVESIAIIPRPTPLPGALGDWLDTFAESFLAAVPVADRPAVKREVEAELRPTLLNAQGVWITDYVRLRFAARKPAEA